jgi:hypothetical protein
MNTKHVLRIGAIGSAVVVLMLIAIAIVLLPLDWAVPGDGVLSGQAQLTPERLNVLQAAFTIDSILILGWFAGWAGIAMLVRNRNMFMGNMTFVLGMIGPMLDFAENGIVWTLVESPEVLPPPVSWYLAWKAIRYASYVVTFAAAVVASMGLWSRKPLDRTMCAIGTAGVAVATTGLFVPAFSLLPNVWWLVWFGCGSLLLWQRATELDADRDHEEQEPG